jgi:hypothetical protein
MEDQQLLYYVGNRINDIISKKGEIANLNNGLEITTHGMDTRLLAWPGTRFHIESINILTLSPGDEGKMYSYAISEEEVLGPVYLIHHILIMMVNKQID